MSVVSAFVGQHFAFAAGRTAILKQHLLSQSDVDRLLGSHNLEEFSRGLTELKLMEQVHAEADSSIALLMQAEQWMKREVEAMTPEEMRPLFGILWLQGDAPRLAYLLKKYHGLSSATSEEPVTSLSVWDADALRKSIEAKMPQHLLPEPVQGFIDTIQHLQEPSPWTIDRAVARFIATLRIAYARRSRSKEIMQYVVHSIDIVNIRTALRLATAKEERDNESDAFIVGGSLPIDRLMGSTQAIHAAIATSELYAPFIASKGRADATAVEHIGAAILAEDIGRMWTVPLTIEPVFAFAAMVMAHVRLLRAIAIGKKNHLSPQEIKQILPPFIPSTQFPA